MRKLLTAGMAALLCLAVLAAPASAKKHSSSEFAFLATIDCGHGPPLVVGSGEDTASPFVDLKTGRIFQPVEWHVAFEGGTFDEIEPDQPKGKRQTCSYDDGFATGRVIVVAMPHGTAGGRR